MYVIHGSVTQKLDSITSTETWAGGSNGSTDGKGAYFTDTPSTAARYATNEGAIYIAELDTSNYIEISEARTLSIYEAEILEEVICSLGSEDIERKLATRIAGHTEREFTSEGDAEAFYEQEIAWANSVGFSDLEPEFQEDRDGKVVIKAARAYATEDDFEGVDIKHIHRILNLHSPDLSTQFFERLADGLIVPKQNGETHYVSFSPVSPEVELSMTAIDSPVDELVATAIDELASNKMRFTIDVERTLTVWADTEGKLHRNQWDFQGDKIELYINRYPRKNISIEGGSAENPAVKKSIEQLVSSNPEWGEAELRFDNYKILANDYVRKSDNSEIKYAYHGTSTAVCSSISELGLAPRELSNADAHFIGHANESLTDRVYLATESGIGAAIFAARSAVRALGGSPIILKVNLSELEEDRLKPDEDSRKLTAKESIETNGCFAYCGLVSPRNLTVADDHFIPEDMKNSFAISLIKQQFPYSPNADKDAPEIESRARHKLKL